VARKGGVGGGGWDWDCFYVDDAFEEFSYWTGFLVAFACKSFEGPLLLDGDGIL
jgi:hypothetical protein